MELSPSLTSLGTLHTSSSESLQIQWHFLFVGLPSTQAGSSSSCKYLYWCSLYVYCMNSGITHFPFFKLRVRVSLCNTISYRLEYGGLERFTCNHCKGILSLHCSKLKGYKFLTYTIRREETYVNIWTHHLKWKFYNDFERNSTN
jgi:hypothetical protein